jgi:outer membrane protein OmpA-like peptidoglycan-associated protein
MKYSSKMRLLPFFILFFSVLQGYGQSEARLKKMQAIEGIPPKVVYRAITHDNAGNLYVATSADVFLIPANSNKAQPMSAGDNIMDVKWSTDNGLVMLVKDGTLRFISSGKVLQLGENIEATCMDASKSTIWVGTTNGVYTVSIEKEKILDHYSTEDGVMLSNQIHFIHTDPFNVKWIGTDKGVVRIAGKNWKLYEEEQAVTAVTSTDEGVWMAADENMWLVNSYNRWFPIDAWKDLTVGRVRAISSDAKGLLYIASNIMVRYDPYEDKIITMTEDSNAAQHILLAQGPQKVVVMASDNGLSRIIEDTTTTFTVASDVKGAPSSDFTVAVELLSTPVCTGASSGRLRVKATGGLSPYTYKWSYENETDNEITNLNPGLYQVTVTDANGLTIVSSGIIQPSPAMTLSTASLQNASDKLAGDGKAIAKVSGGASPVMYTWDNDERTAEAVALTEGIHGVTITDANGCSLTSEVAVEAEKVLKSLDISTLTLGQTIRVDKLYFEADSSTIEPTSFAVLEEIYDFLKSHENVTIEIGGHTNSLPEDEYCDFLSTSRAKNVALHLYSKGIRESQIMYKGYGKRQPVATNQTVDGRRRNQRVEIKIVSL